MKKTLLKSVTAILSLVMLVSLIPLNATAYYYTDIPEKNLNALGNVDKRLSDITVSDAKAVLSYIASVKELDEEQKYAADVNMDGKINTLDAKQILKYCAELDVFRVNLELTVGQEYTLDPGLSITYHAWKPTLTWDPYTGSGIEIEESHDSPEPEDIVGGAGLQYFKIIAKAPGTYDLDLKYVVVFDQSQVEKEIIFTITVNER